MEHIPLDIICKIADEKAEEKELDQYLAHIEQCKICQKEVELQRSILKISRNKPLVTPSKTFTDNVLSEVIPAGKKKWYEWMLNNMGNVFAMVSVIAFLVYVLSLTENTDLNQEPSNKNTQITEIMKSFKDISLSIYEYFNKSINIPDFPISGMGTLSFALIAIIILVFIDQILSKFLKRLKILS
ncbi:MAG: hypothetical protein JXA06_05580 [Bacteroidetes bacterium]|nr:hypothetical protein [Bacteroidota bacterium]